VRNTDDHPRNHRFLVEQGGLILSPLFDVEPSLARPGVGADYFLAMSIGPQGRLAALGNLRSVAATFNLKPVDADDLILRMQTGVATGWRDELGKVGFDDRELDVLAPSFETTA
jgi:serine/threonine-protein kinase HipA